MKLTSKEICPITVRDRLVKNLANQDIGIMDIKRALEWAEAKCLELNKENKLLHKELNQCKILLIKKIVFDEQG